MNHNALIYKLVLAVWGVLSSIVSYAQSGDDRYEHIRDKEGELLNMIDGHIEEGEAFAYKVATNLLTILSDPISIDYPFDELGKADKYDIRVITSPDRKLRYYVNWDRHVTGMYATWIITQYVYEDEVRLSFEDTEMLPIIISIDDYYADGRKYYLVESWFRLSYSGRMIAPLLMATRITNNGPVTEDSVGPGFVNYLNYSFNKDPDDLCNHQRWKKDDDEIIIARSVPGPDWEKESLSVFSGRYDSYKICDGKFILDRKDFDDGINKAIADYECLEVVFKTNKYIVRVDRLKDGSYRYSSWPSNGSMMSSPDLIIKGGLYKEESNEFIFSNKGYYYIVGDGLRDSNHYIKVIKDSMTLLYEKRGSQ